MVRATFAGFSTALSAIQANQKRLDVVGQNLANMNTPGYTRQKLETSSLNYSSPVSNFMNGSEILVGFGVSMDKVVQIRDPYLDAQYRTQMQKAGYTESLKASLDKLSKVFDESSIEGIHQAFLNINSTLLNMQDTPKVNNPIYETELRTRMQALTNLLNDASRQIDEAERQERIQLDGTSTTENGAVDTVNRLLEQIGGLNRQIKHNQILGQQSLELMDERNMLLDELASYIPIEVTYYKDPQHDGIDPNKNAPNADPNAGKAELYHLDSNGNIIARKEWPDDVRVDMLYTEGNTVKKLTLVEGTEGTGNENYGKLEIQSLTNAADPAIHTKFSITVTESKAQIINGATQISDGATAKPTKVTLSKADVEKGVQLTSGSIQASLDMMWKDGETTGLDDANGYEYYRKQLDLLAKSFAEVMNKINIEGAKGKDTNQFLLADKKDGSTDDITAANISISAGWVSGSVHISTAGESGTDTVLNMLEAMKATWPYTADNSSLKKTLDLTDATGGTGAAVNPNLKHNSFSDYMNHVSTVLANDAYNNSNALKTNVTVLNAVQDSRDALSGVSMNEEASNMMMYQAAYNAASRLMTTLDEMLNTLINGTGLVGR